MREHFCKIFANRCKFTASNGSWIWQTAGSSSTGATVSCMQQLYCEYLHLIITCPTKLMSNLSGISVHSYAPQCATFPSEFCIPHAKYPSGLSGFGPPLYVLSWGFKSACDTGKNGTLGNLVCSELKYNYEQADHKETHRTVSNSISSSREASRRMSIHVTHSTVAHHVLSAKVYRVLEDLTHTDHLHELVLDILTF